MDSLSRAFAQQLDQNDSLKHYRTQFHIPKDAQGNSLLYLCGNSLGLQPKKAATYITQELADWATLGVEGHTQAKNPWLPYHESLSTQMAKVVGAHPEEVVVMNGLTTNLHLMMVSFYTPTKSRYKIIIEKDAFPSDKYAVESQLKYHNIPVNDGLIFWEPNKNTDYYCLEDLTQLLETHGSSIALVLLGNTNYYTGQYYPIKEITSLAHKQGSKVGFDLAHGAGNICPDLHASGPDFAVWCSYKYLNSGPGSIAGCFVHERHANNPNLKRFTGWWGHNKQNRFEMRHDFEVLPGAEGWQLSNPPILAMASLRASLELFNSAGMQAIRAKGKKLSSFMYALLENLNNNSIRILTPRNENERGCQLSIQIKGMEKKAFEALTESGVICDWREPNVIRVAPAPLYNTFEEVFTFVEKLNTIITV